MSHMMATDCSLNCYSCSRHNSVQPLEVAVANTLKRATSCNAVLGRCVFLLCVTTMVIVVGCTDKSCVPPESGSDKQFPIVLQSSADLGYASSDSDVVRRIVKLQNVTNHDLAITHWTASCECLTIMPESLDVRAGSYTLVELVLDLHSGTDKFVGTLAIVARAFGGSTCLCTFDIPIVVVDKHETQHLSGRDEH